MCHNKSWCSIREENNEVCPVDCIMVDIVQHKEIETDADIINKFLETGK